MLKRFTNGSLATLIALACADPPPPGPGTYVLPTGKRLDPAGRLIELGNMPLAIVLAPGGRQAIVSLNGWRDQALEVIDLRAGRVVQRLPQTGAFLGIAFAADGKSLYSSGGASDLIYRYLWDDGGARLIDSLSLRRVRSDSSHSHFPAGLAISPDARRLYVAENLADSLAVLDLATGRVVQRLPTGPSPYAVAVDSAGRVFVSSWGGNSIALFHPGPDGRLDAAGQLEVGRHPSALALNRDATRLFVTSASTDRIAVVDTREERVVAVLADSVPGGPSEGSTPDALVLSPDSRRLFVAEADNNAVAVYELSDGSAGVPTGRSTDSLVGRIPSAWYPTALAAGNDSLLVVSGKGRGTGPNPTGPIPGIPWAKVDPHAYTLGQLNGTLSLVPLSVTSAKLASLTRRVTEANGWSAPAARGAGYPPFEHVILIIKENRTYDQVLGDLPGGDGDSTLVFFPRRVAPNHHALAERFGLFDRFFVNAEVSAQGHPWSTAAYVTDYIEKTAPLVYANKRPEVDEVGEVDLPAAGFIWSAALRRGLSVRNYGEYAIPDSAHPGSDGQPRYTSRMPDLAAVTSAEYPPFDLRIPDQRRVDVWIRELEGYAARGRMPAFELMHLPSDHLAAARPGYGTPRAYMADNDLALGRLVEALSQSPFWKSTVVFVLEDDAQAGPDHVDSHRSILLAISPYSRPATVHRFVNTTDVLATIEELLGLGALSQFDRHGRPLREIWSPTPDLRPYAPLVPAQSLEERNAVATQDARDSERLDLTEVDRADDGSYNRLLWRMLKGTVPYPRPRRLSSLEFARVN